MASSHHPTSSKRSKAVNRWSQHVNQTSDALDLEAGVFKLRSARAIAASLKRSAERSERRKGSPFQSAMSMLNFLLIRMMVISARDACSFAISTSMFSEPPDSSVKIK